MRATSATLMSLAVAVSGFLSSCAQSAHQESGDSRQDFNIAAQPVSQALRVYAQQSGDQIVFYSDISKGRESAPVEGRYTRQEALQKLLENTGLQHHRVNSKTVAISAATSTTDASLKRTSTVAPLWHTQATDAPSPAAQRPVRGAETIAAEDSLFGVEQVIAITYRY